MVLSDLHQAFRYLDSRSRGYITGLEVIGFLNDLDLGPVSNELVELAIHDVCGSGDDSKVVREQQFSDVIDEVVRRKRVEEAAFWDFRMLCTDSGGLINLSAASFLFESTFGPGLYLYHWKSFLAGRPANRKDDSICWADVRLALGASSLPAGADTDDVEGAEGSVQARKRAANDLEEGEMRRKQQKLEKAEKLENINSFAVIVEQDQYMQNAKRGARSNLHRWEQGGLGALLFPSSSAANSLNQSAETKKSVSVTALMDSLDRKYSSLRKKLLWFMMQQYLGELLEVNDEQTNLDLFNELQIEERYMRNKGRLLEDGQRLMGADISLEGPLQSLLQLLGPASFEFASWLEEGEKELDSQREAGGTNPNSGAEIIDRRWTRAEDIHCAALLIGLDRRQKLEKDLLKAAITGSTKCSGSGSLQPTTITSAYCRLFWEQLIIDKEPDLATTLLLTGITERSTFQISELLEPFEKKRYSEVFAVKIDSWKPKRKKGWTEQRVLTSEEKRLHMGKINLEEEIIENVQKKHDVEMELLISLLKGKGIQRHFSNALEMNEGERQKKLTMISEKYTVLVRESGANRINEALKATLFQEALAFLLIEIKERLEAARESSDEQTLNIQVLTDLKRLQHEEVNRLIDGFSKQNVLELREIHKLGEEGLSTEQCTHLTGLLFDSVICSEEELIIVAALEKKYETLRRRLLEHALSCQRGVTWFGLPEDVRLKEIAKLQAKEKELSQQEKYKEMDSELLTNELARGIHLHTLLGLHRTQAGGKHGSHDFLQDTGGVFETCRHRFHSERQNILLSLRSKDGEKFAETNDFLLFLIDMETFLVSMCRDFPSASYHLGLMERFSDAASANGRTADDARRLEKLGDSYYDLSTKLRKMNVKYRKTPSGLALPDDDDRSGWMKSVVREIFHKHDDERQTLLYLVTDDSQADLRILAQGMNQDERQSRLIELAHEKRWLLVEDEESANSNMSILEEAAALKITSLGEEIGNAGSEVEGHSCRRLLTNLLSRQDREVSHLLHQLNSMSLEELKSIKTVQARLRQWNSCEHVIAVFSDYTGQWTNERIFTELSVKYSALEKKMLETIFLGQNPAWLNLNDGEKEKQRNELKRKIVLLQKTGASAEIELESVYYTIAESSKEFYAIFGQDPHFFTRSLRKYKNGPGNSTEDEPTVDFSAPDPVFHVKDMLAALTSRQEEEKKMLIDLFEGRCGFYPGELVRQAECARLSHHTSLVLQSGTFNEAALRTGLMERTGLIRLINPQGEQSRRYLLTEDWKRELELSSLYVLALAETSVFDWSPKVPSLDRSARLTLCKSLIDAYTVRQEGERLCLNHLVLTMPSDVTDLVSTSSAEDRYLKVEEMKASGLRVNQDSVREFLSSLYWLCEVHLLHWSGKDDIEEESSSCVMGQLLDNQLFEKADLIHSLGSWDDSRIVLAYESVCKEIETKECPILLRVLLHNSPAGTKLSGESALVSAVEGKYDALKDQLLTDALLKDYGEHEWNQLSEQEKQRKLAKLKMKEAKLRKEGRLDEAEELISNLLATGTNLDGIMEDEKEAQAKMMRERQKKRRQRVMQGMDEEEADKLEEKEAEADEQKIKQSRRSVLQNLENRCDEEKQLILKQLSSAEDGASRERYLQMEAARLRQEKRKVKGEENSETAALLLGMMKTHLTEGENDREKQRQLARQRLAARKRSQVADDSAEENSQKKPTVDANDAAALSDASIQEVETRHGKERTFLIKALQKVEETELYQTSSGESSEEASTHLLRLSCLAQLFKFGGTEWSMEEWQDLLKESVCYKLLSGENSTDTSMEDRKTELMADLQVVQDTEMSSVIKHLEEQPAQYSQEVLSAEAGAIGIMGNISSILLPASLGGPRVQRLPSSPHLALSDALEAAGDVLLEKILGQQVGENNWDGLSALHKLQKIAESKSARINANGELLNAGGTDKCGLYLADISAWMSSLIPAASSSENKDGKRKVKFNFEKNKQKKPKKKSRKNKQTGNAAAAEDHKEEGTNGSESNAAEDKMEDDDGTDDKTETDVVEGADANVAEDKSNSFSAVALQSSSSSSDEKESGSDVEESRMSDAAEDTSAGLRSQDLTNSLLKSQTFLEKLQRLFGEKQGALTTYTHSLSKTEESERKVFLESAKLRLIQKKIREKSTMEDSVSYLVGYHTLSDPRQPPSTEACEKMLRDFKDSSNSGGHDNAEDSDLSFSISLQMVSDLATGTGGRAAVQEKGLYQLMLKQVAEKRAFLQMMTELCDDIEVISQAPIVGLMYIRKALEKQEQEKVIWAQQFKTKDVGEDSSHFEEQKAAYRDALLKVLQYRAMVEAMNTVGKEIDHEMMETICVQLLSDFLSRQKKEEAAFHSALVEEDDGIIITMGEVLTSHRLKGWHDNISKVGFSVLDKDNMWEAESKRMEKNYETDKERLMEQMKIPRERRKSGTINAEGLLQQLELEHNNQLKAMNSQLKRQQELMTARRQERRQSQMLGAVEEARELLQKVQGQETEIAEREATEKDKQRELMRQRLAKNRDARSRMIHGATPSPPGSGKGARKASADFFGAMVPQSMGLKRERTVIRGPTEEQKMDEASKLVLQQKEREARMTDDQKAQQDEVRRRRSERMSQKEDELVALFRKGRTQKKNLETGLNKDRDEQKAAVSRRRYERTHTHIPQESNRKPRVSFDELAGKDNSESGDSSGTQTNHSRMMAAAAKLNSRFKAEEEDIKEGKTDVKDLLREEGSEEAEGEGTWQETANRLSKEEQMRKIKQRREEKKKKRALAKKGSNLSEAASAASEN